MLASLIEQRTGLGGTKRCLDGLDAIAGRERLLIIDEDRVHPFETAIGHQQMLGSSKIDRRGLDRVVELFGVFGIDFRIGFHRARVHGDFAVERVELEIDAAALRQRRPIRPAGIGALPGDDAVAFIDGRRWDRMLDFLRLTLLLAVPRLRVRAGGGDERDKEKSDLE